ncbi:MAG: flagellar basal body-associated FliL family protein [Deltaproteobacteria bacterium]|nr:flagellar basal body-associated FliL family protein [Deltaproteobacteria bacterium]
MAEKNKAVTETRDSWKIPCIISLVALSLLTGACITWIFLSKNQCPPLAKKSPAPNISQAVQVLQNTGIGPMVDIDEFIVNIISADSNHYVKTSLTLELTTDIGKDEIEQRIPQIRDTILLLLGNKTYDELQDLQGKKQLKAELMNKINSFLHAGKVKSIYFTNFVVQ